MGLSVLAPFPIGAGFAGAAAVAAPVAAQMTYIDNAIRSIT